MRTRTLSWISRKSNKCSNGFSHLVFVFILLQIHILGGKKVFPGYDLPQPSLGRDLPNALCYILKCVQMWSDVTLASNATSTPNQEFGGVWSARHSPELKTIFFFILTLTGLRLRLLRLSVDEKKKKANIVRVVGHSNCVVLNWTISLKSQEAQQWSRGCVL